MRDIDLTVEKLMPSTADKLATQSGIGLALTYHHELSVIHAHQYAISLYQVPEWILNHFRSGKLVHKPAIDGKVNGTMRAKESTKFDISSVGGKGANLIELSKIKGIKVPEGFCVTTEAYKKAFENNVELNLLLDQLSLLKKK